MLLWKRYQEGTDLWWERGRGKNNFQPFHLKLFQVNSYPWIAALLRDEDIEAEFINSQCGSVLVSALSYFLICRITVIIKQIGNRFALTAAHCLYDDDNEELLPASSFSIMLGLHDRRKTKEPNR